MRSRQAAAPSHEAMVAPPQMVMSPDGKQKAIFYQNRTKWLPAGSYSLVLDHGPQALL